ncbi:MAG TPA: Rieske 2Fe-2S domain-containing protein [Candidatus Tectomicrobia bacterium]|jgi:phenylpropionate dioxygenase-like ring-hydroxylating dioxygenase large terminal subunit
MLSKEDNELLCRVGPGTPMGTLMRQYWIPAARSDELPAPGGAPLRVRLLGEDLIAFRVASGKVGLVANNCPHRGASLFYGRNEGEGLRCVYHGWKFDVTGACVDLPSEPPESNFKSKVRTVAYPCVERGGVIWTYMGSRATPPPLPDLEANMVPESRVTTMIRHCNYMQALEGDIDTVHFAFLHMGHLTLEHTYEGNFLYYQIRERAPRYAATDTEFGTCYGAYRPAAEDTYYWRFANFLFPFYTQIPPGTLAVNRGARAWVPMDDEHTMFFGISAPPAGGVVTAPERSKRQDVQARRGSGQGGSFGATEMLPDTTDWYGRSRPKADASNDYLLDREKVQSGASYTGLPSVVLEDQAITESMGPICKRWEEHLGTSDIMIIRTRLRLIRAAQALQEKGEIPPGVDQPGFYRQRSGGVILPRSADWLEATRDLRRAFVEYPEEFVLETIGERKHT